MPATYLQFVTANRRFITFGFAMAFVSSFGQTYFIGVFGPSLQREFGLSHTAWGTVYMVGTLASALVLPWSGKHIDRLDLRRYTLYVALLLAGGCAFMASAVTGVVTLVLAVFFLRQAGQGLASHIVFTSMTRYFEDNRGRAVAVATLGFSAGEALLPVGAVFLVSTIGWRWSYGAVAVFILIVLGPSVMWLLRGHDVRHRDHVVTASAARDTAARRSWTRREVLGDLRFYLLLPGVLAPALIITALFFHHLTIAHAKGWSDAWITANYVIFAGASTAVALGCGPLVDRFGGRRLVPFMLLPLAAGLVVLATFDHALTVTAYFLLIGGSVGIAHTAIAALWAELYGVDHLGAIRSVATALAVFASALGPISVGGLIDAGVGVNTALLLLAAYAVFGSVLMIVALRVDRRGGTASGLRSPP